MATGKRIVLWLSWALGFALPAFGLTVTNYSSAGHDRFSSGYPTAPVANTNGAFIGLGYDWSGVGWLSANPTKGFALLSPMHYLVARHYTNQPGAAVTFVNADGTLITGVENRSVQTDYGVVFVNETYGDMAIGILSSPLPATSDLTYYSILDRTSYTGQPLLLYGRGPHGASSPRVGEASVDAVSTGGTYGSGFRTLRNLTQLEVNDSGSPAFIPWTNAAGRLELTLLGNHAAINETYNFINFLPRAENIASMNAILLQDGFAARWVGNVTHTWVGGNSAPPGSQTEWNRNNNWAQRSQPTSTSYIRFDTNSTSYQTVNLNAGSQSARGLYFTAGAFVLTNGTLNLGKGGLVNYDPTTKPILKASTTLTDHQYWDGGDGGFEATGAVNLGAHRLIVEGSGAGRVDGVVSGSGGITKAGSGLFTLSGPNTYSGDTVVAGGLLRIEASAGSATGSGNVKVHAYSALGGAGWIAGNLEALSGGILAPGSTVAGTLVIGGDLTLAAGANFVVELYGAGLYDLVMVTGGVTVGGATLDVTLSYVPALDIRYVILNNQGAGAVSGVFAGLAQGAYFQAGGADFQISYTGGTGNDVVLTVVPEPLSTGYLAVAVLAAAFRRAYRRQKG